MKTDHTPEPWRIGTPPPNGEQTIGNEKGLMVAVATTGHGVSAEANARRIVACVNACAGISTEALESEGSAVMGWNRTASKLIRATKQREELLAALERSLESFEYIAKYGNSCGHSQLRIPDLKAAIASVKEK